MLLLTVLIGFVPGVVYPIARSLPVLLVGLGDVLRGRIGVILAFVIYKEQGRAIRLAGTFVLASGLVLISLWGG